MSFFCENEKAPGVMCGTRIVAPGHCVACKGSVPEFDGTSNASAAEHAADRELAKHRDAKGEVAATPQIFRSCLSAAMASLAKPKGSEVPGDIKGTRTENKSAGKPAVQ